MTDSSVAPPAGSPPGASTTADDGRTVDAFLARAREATDHALERALADILPPVQPALGDAVRYMLGGSMAVLDTAAKYREVLLFNRYQAGRDNIARFRSEPPSVQMIPSTPHSLIATSLMTG